VPGRGRTNRSPPRVGRVQRRRQREAERQPGHAGLPADHHLRVAAEEAKKRKEQEDRRD
jgi:hypothetical protein